MNGTGGLGVYYEAAGGFDAFVTRAMASLQTELADEIFAQLGEHSGVRYDFWLMRDGRVTAWHPTWYPREPENGLALMWKALDVEDLLGPDWSYEMPVDDEGVPIVTREDADNWACAWSEDNARGAIYEALDDAERLMARDNSIVQCE
jgi:hypothetical protein